MRKGVIAATAITFLTLGVGCMSFSFGGRTEVVSPHETSAIADVTAEQKGHAQLASGDEITVYYPVPFASPPNLVIHDPASTCRVVEQRADCFRIKNNASVAPWRYDIGWTARGVKTLPPAAVGPPPTSPALANPVTQ